MNRIGLAPTPHTSSPTVLALISTRTVGGPGKGLLQLASSLGARGRTTFLLSSFHRIGEGETPFMRAARERGIPLYLIEQRFSFDWRAFGQLRRLIREARVDVLQTHGYKENIFGLLAKLSTGKTWICFLHGTTDENVKVRMYHAIDRLVVRYSDRILSVSRELARRVLPARRHEAALIVENAISPNPVTCTPFQLAAWRRRHGVRRGNVIVCVGRLSPEKGQDVLIEAAAILRRNDWHFQILLVGDGPMRIALAQRTVELGLTNQVTFVGNQQDMSLVYRSGDVLVLSSRKEGMPNVILEAMQHGLPVVATRVGGVPEMVRDGVDAVLVPPDDAHALASGLRWILSDKVRAKKVASAARDSLYPRFSPERRAREMERIYADLGGKR